MSMRIRSATFSVKIRESALLLDDNLSSLLQISRLTS
jgi:hypothetical protein